MMMIMLMMGFLELRWRRGERGVALDHPLHRWVFVDVRYDSRTTRSRRLVLVRPNQRTPALLLLRIHSNMNTGIVDGHVRCRPNQFSRSKCDWCRRGQWLSGFR